jgi:ATP-dependent helicase HrpA
VFVETLGGVDVYGYPGLSFQKGTVSLQLFKSAREADATAPAAVRQLAEWALGKEVAWLDRELRVLSVPAAKASGSAGNFQDALSQLGNQLPSTKGHPVFTTDVLREAALEHILRACLQLEPLRPLTAERFQKLVDGAKASFTPMAQKAEELTKQCFAMRTQILAATKRYANWEADLQRLLPPDFLAKTPPAQLPHLPRYLKAMLIRGERAHLNPAKDADKFQAIAQYHDWRTEAKPEHHETLRWMFEEYRVSSFAPELGTAQTVSPKRMEVILEM